MKMIANHFLIEQLSRQRQSEALREAEHERLLKQVALQSGLEPGRHTPAAGSEGRGRMIPDATGAREVPSL